MAETPEQPLLTTPSGQAVVNVGAQAQGTRSKRAYKVAGITLLACVLIVSQGAIAYFLLSQRSDIKSLEEQNNGLKDEMTKVQSGSMSLNSGMSAGRLNMVGLVEQEAFTGTPAPHETTKCEREASGLKPANLPGFLPLCDERGLYKTQQCWQGHCWCVNTVTGEAIPNTMGPGPAQCNRARFAGGMAQFQALADTDD